MESLRSFSINANRAHFAVADVNRTSFQECLIHIRDTVENVADFLKKKATLPVFDFSASTVTRIENDLKNQTDEMKAGESDCIEERRRVFDFSRIQREQLEYALSELLVFPHQLHHPGQRVNEHGDSREVHRSALSSFESAEPNRCESRQSQDEDGSQQLCKETFVCLLQF